MRADKFYSVPYSARIDPKMKYIRRKCGGIVAFGRWQALLGILYDEDATIDLSDEVMHKVIEDELEFNKPEQLDEFIEVLAAVGWLSRDAWESFRKVHSESVYEQLHYKDRYAEAGAKGGRGKKRAKAAESKQESETESKAES